MTRAEAFGMRGSILDGGSTVPVFIVTKRITGGDTSRGIPGTPQTQEVLIDPAPSVLPIRSSFILQSNVRLKDGDIEIDIPSFQVEEYVFKSPDTLIRLGNPPKGQLLQIIDYIRDEYQGGVVRFRIFCRGMVV